MATNSEFAGVSSISDTLPRPPHTNRPGTSHTRPRSPKPNGSDTRPRPPDRSDPNPTNTRPRSPHTNGPGTSDTRPPPPKPNEPGTSNTRPRPPDPRDVNPTNTRPPPPKPKEPDTSNTRPRRPRSLADRLEAVVDSWATSQYELVTLAAEFADSPEWILTGSPTPAHWLAIIADVEPCTTREWIRIGRLLQALPATADALRTRQISYSKARALTRLATSVNERELLDIASTTTAADLGRALAAWLHQNSEPEDVAAYQHRQRSVKWRTEPDGMTVFTLRLPPWLAGVLISLLTTWIMTSRPKPDCDGDWPSVAQQHADAIDDLVNNGAGHIDAEVVVHVTGDGNHLDDGTPIADSVVAGLIPDSFISALVYDSRDNPIDATNRRRHPSRRQKRLVKARDERCVDCGRNHLLEYDHVPEFEQTGHTVTTELALRCAPCHDQRHKTTTAGPYEPSRSAPEPPAERDAAGENEPPYSSTFAGIGPIVC